MAKQLIYLVFGELLKRPYLKKKKMGEDKKRGGGEEEGGRGRRFTRWFSG